MLLFTDVLCNDELCSDAYNPKEVDDIVYEIDCQTVVIKDGDVDIGKLASDLTGQCQPDVKRND